MTYLLYIMLQRTLAYMCLFELWFSQGICPLVGFLGHVLSCFIHVRLFAIPWTIACQSPLSMGFSRQEYWSGLLCPPPGDLPKPGIKTACLYLLHWQKRFTNSTNWNSKTDFFLQTLSLSIIMQLKLHCRALYKQNQNITRKKWINQILDHVVPQPIFSNAEV